MSSLEKESLEAHVDLCAERYNALIRDLKNLGSRMDKFENTLQELRDMMITMKSDRQKQLINWGTTIIAALVTACGTLVYIIIDKV